MAEKEEDLAKRVPPLGPFPRIIWIHQDTPLDRLDEVCYDIWKRTQHLPDVLKPKHTSTLPEEPKDVHAEHRAEPVINKKDELTCLVEQEYMNLIMENLFDCCQSVASTIQNKDIDKEALNEVAQALMIEKKIKALLFKKESPGKILPKKAIKRWSQNRYVMKNKSTNQDINNDCSKTEDHKLLAQSPVKTTEALSTKTTETVMPSSLKTSDVTVTLNSENPRTENHHKEKSQQLSVFGKLCSKAQVPKSQKYPPGFTMVPRVSTFPGMIRQRQPILAPLPTPSSAILIPMNHLCLRRFPHPGPRKNFHSQYQARFLQRPPVPFLQGSQVGCYPRQFYSVTPQQHCFFYSTFVPQVNNLQHVRLNSSYQQRTAAMPIGGPQFYHHAYRFSSTYTGTILNRTYGPSFKNGMRPC